MSAVTAFIALLNSEAMAKHDLSSLTKVYTGGAPTPPGVLDDWHQRTGTRIQPMYGLTEATSPTHMTPHGVVPPVDARTGAMSIGVPVFDTDVRIVTDVGLDAAPREIGELVIAGPQIIPGYWQKPKETAESLRDGELRTGDVGFMDEQGWFYLVDRAKDMIVASGFKVWPREVEEVLYLHPAVREAAVIGIARPVSRRDHQGGHQPQGRARRPPPNEIKAFARERMAAYKYPRVVEIVDDLPKTTSGKIMRRLLQTTATAADAAAGARSSSSPACRIRSCAPRSRRARCSKSGAVWLRLSRGAIPRSHLRGAVRAAARHARPAGRRRADSSTATPGSTANEAYHAAVIDLAENEHLSRAFRRLRLRELLAAALKDTPRTPENVVSLHEHQTDAIAAGDADAAVQAILSWGETSRAGIREALGGVEHAGRGCC